MPLYRSVPDWEEWKENREATEDSYEPSFLKESTTDSDLLTDGGEDGD
jgi:hypothetical protein